jgi:hypothetical protein
VRYEGHQVCLHGLVSKPEYNWRRGIVLKHTETRWVVHLESEGSS